MHEHCFFMCVCVCFQCPLEKRCVCEKGEKGPSGPAVSKYAPSFDRGGCGLFLDGSASIHLALES